MFGKKREREGEKEEEEVEKRKEGRGWAWSEAAPEQRSPAAISREREREKDLDRARSLSPCAHCVWILHGGADFIVVFPLLSRAKGKRLQSGAVGCGERERAMFGVDGGRFSSRRERKQKKLDQSLKESSLHSRATTPSRGAATSPERRGEARASQRGRDAPFRGTAGEGAGRRRGLKEEEKKLGREGAKNQSEKRERVFDDLDVDFYQVTCE